MSDEQCKQGMDTQFIVRTLKAESGYNLALFLYRLQDNDWGKNEWKMRSNEMFRLYHAEMCKVNMFAPADNPTAPCINNGTYFQPYDSNIRVYARFRAAKSWNDVIVTYNAIDYMNCSDALSMVRLQEYIDDIISGVVESYLKVAQS